jgi:cyanophycinase-like exopeptidase
MSKTRYILVGGADRNAKDGGRALGEAMAHGLDNAPKVLSCLFAEPREVWEEKFITRQAYFAVAFGQEVECELAMPSTFEVQVKAADVIYLHGGDDALLGHYLDTYDLPKLFAGKTVVGTSAGGDYLSTIYWTCDWRTIGHGSGLVPVAYIPHFKSTYGKKDPRGPIDWEKAQQELHAATTLPLCCLKEAEFEVFDIETDRN